MIIPIGGMNRRSLATVFTNRTARTVRLTRDANRRTYSAGREWTGTVAQCSCRAFQLFGTLMSNSDTNWFIACRISNLFLIKIVSNTGQRNIQWDLSRQVNLKECLLWNVAVCIQSWPAFMFTIWECILTESMQEDIIVMHKRWLYNYKQVLP